MINLCIIKKKLFFLAIFVGICFLLINLCERVISSSRIFILSSEVDQLMLPISQPPIFSNGEIIGDIDISRTHFFSKNSIFPNQINFSPDGKMLSIINYDELTKIWDVKTGKLIFSLDGNVNSLDFDPTSKYIAIATNNCIKLLTIDVRKEIKKICKDTKNISSICFSPNGEEIAIGSRDGVVEIWNVNTDKVIWSKRKHHNVIWSVKFSPDGQFLCTVSGDRSTKLWDANAGKMIRSFDNYVSSNSTFSSNGTFGFISENNSIRLMNIFNIKRFKENFAFFRSKDINSLNFSPDNSLLVTSAYNGKVKLWNILNDTKPKSVLKPLSLISVFHPNGTMLATLEKDNRQLVLLSVSDRRVIKKMSKYCCSINTVKFSPNKSIIATGSSDKTVKLWDSNTGKNVTSLFGHIDAINSICFSPNGQVLATGSHDAKIKLWDISSGKELKTLSGHSSSVTSVSFNSDGKQIISTSYDKTFKIWDVLSTKVLRTFSLKDDEIRCAIFSKNNKLIATTSWNGYSKLWNISTGQIKNLDSDCVSIDSLAFSRDGKLLATAPNSRIKIWDVDSGKEVKIFLGHKNTVQCIEFSPNGKILATGSYDKTVKIWEVDSGKEINSFRESSHVNSLSFSPDGNNLAIALDNGINKILNVQTGKNQKILIGNSEYWVSYNYLNKKLWRSVPDDNNCPIPELKPFWKINSLQKKPLLETKIFIPNLQKSKYQPIEPDQRLMIGEGETGTNIIVVEIKNIGKAPALWIEILPEYENSGFIVSPLRGWTRLEVGEVIRIPVIISHLYLKNIYKTKDLNSIQEDILLNISSYSSRKNPTVLTLPVATIFPKPIIHKCEIQKNNLKLKVKNIGKQKIEKLKIKVYFYFENTNEKFFSKEIKTIDALNSGILSNDINIHIPPKLIKTIEEKKLRKISACIKLYNNIYPTHSRIENKIITLNDTE